MILNSYNFIEGINDNSQNHGGTNVPNNNFPGPFGSSFTDTNNHNQFMSFNQFSTTSKGGNAGRIFHEQQKTELQSGIQQPSVFSNMNNISSTQQQQQQQQQQRFNPPWNNGGAGSSGWSNYIKPGYIHFLNFI